MRKTAKRLLSLLICLGMLFSASQFSLVFAEEQTPVEIAKNDENALVAKAFISSMGADAVDIKDMSAPATRADFVTVLMSLMNMDSPYGTDTEFEDVPNGTLLANVTNFAVATGIVSKGVKFNPNDQVTYTQAAKMTVAALGCGQKADVLGGYPHGYLRLASENDLNEGLSGNEAMTAGDMYIMLSNLCETNVYEFVSYEHSQGVINHVLAEGKPFMQVYRNICRAEGIVDAAYGSYLYDNSATIEKGCISVDDVVYKISDDVEYDLGMNVRIYYKNEGKNRETAVFVRPIENKVTTLSYKNYPELKNGKLTYLNEGTDREYKLTVDSLCAVLYNGRSDDSLTDADFSIDAGYIKAIDNDGDNVIEVLSLWEPQYLEIGAVNPYDGIIYDANFKTNIFVDENDIIFSSDKNIEDLTIGEVVEVYISNDGKSVKLNTVENTVTGIVTAYGANREIYLDDVKYTTDSYFDDFYRKNVALSSNVTFVVSDDGVIVSVKSLSTTDYLYAYLDNIKQTSGLSSKVLVRIYSQSDEVIETELSEKVILNSRSVSSSECYTVLNNLKGTIIKYRTDDKNVITAVNTVMDEEGLYDPIYDGYSSVKRYRFPNDDTSTQIPYKSFGYFVPYFTISAATIIFCVSPDTTLSDEDRFSMAKSLTFLDNDQKVASNSLKPYNVSDTGHASVLLYEAAVKGDVNVDRAPCGIVAECSLALDESYNEVYKLVMYKSNSYSTMYIKKDASFIADMNLKAGEMPFNTGDVIRYSSASGIYIENATKDFDGKNRELLNTSGDNKMVHYYYGYLYSVGASSIAILREDGTMVYVPVGISTVCMVDENDVYTTAKERISTYKQTGENATKILVKCRYSAVEQMYMFK